MLTSKFFSCFSVIARVRERRCDEMKCGELWRDAEIKWKYSANQKMWLVLSIIGFRKNKKRAYRNLCRFESFLKRLWVLQYPCEVIFGFEKTMWTS